MKKLIVAIALMAAALQLAAVTMFEKGKWQADIVIPDNPGQAETFAAKELKHHLSKATGVEINIVKESEKSTLPCHFFIGNTAAAKAAGINKAKLEPDSHLVKSVSNGLLLLGGDRDGLHVANQWSAACQGTLYAVYEYLEKYLGVRWLWPGDLGEVVPKQPEIKINNINLAGGEPLTVRNYVKIKPNNVNLFGWSSLEARQKFMDAESLFLIRHRMGAKEKLYYGHGFTNYWKRFGQTHPEFFSLLPNGKREPLIGNKEGDYITMCVSNEGFQNQIIKDWQRLKISKNIVNACENDTPGMCTCTTCRSWDAPDPRFAKSDYWARGKDPLTRRGRFYRLAFVAWGEEGDDGQYSNHHPPVSDRYAKFYMAVLKKAKAVNPNARVSAYAYANYLEAPKETKLDKDVIIIHVPNIGFPYSKSDSETFRESWAGWRKAGVRDLILRPNYTLLGANLPINSGRAIADDFAWAYKNGMVGTSFDSLTGVYANHAANIYTLTRIHRQPDFGYENAINEYCAVFAPADKEIREYMDFWEKFCNNLSRKKILEAGNKNKDVNGNIAGGHNNFIMLAHDLYPAEVFAEANAILDRASKKAAGNDLTLQRIDFLRKGLKDAELTAQTSAAYRKWINAKAANRPRAERVVLSANFNQAFKALVDFRLSVEGDFINNMANVATKEFSAANWPHKYTKIKKNKK